MSDTGKVTRRPTPSGTFVYDDAEFRAHHSTADDDPGVTLHVLSAGFELVSVLYLTPDAARRMRDALSAALYVGEAAQVAAPEQSAQVLGWVSSR